MGVPGCVVKSALVPKIVRPVTRSDRDVRPAISSSPRKNPPEPKTAQGDMNQPG